MSYEGSASYSVHVTVTKDPNADAVSAHVTYPSLGCGGSWTFRGAEGSRYMFTESISYGTNVCAASGDVSVTYNQDSNDWQRYSSTAAGTL